MVEDPVRAPDERKAKTIRPAVSSGMESEEHCGLLILGAGRDRTPRQPGRHDEAMGCLLYTSDAADEFR
ncbi:MAG: hypothetical protein QUU85_06735, partial [Candidatus Eisenbacteria bacterium]|nr:hypothetical protein [Candidatus Eisenbacteria bacterium]